MKYLKRPFCPNCERPRRTCLCSVMVRLDSRYRIVILQDPIEARHALSTAPLLEKSLRNAQRNIDETFDPQVVIGPDWQDCAVLVYPGENPISAEHIREQPQRNTLIFLDGTWRKTGRLLRLNAWLQLLPRMALDAKSQRSNYRIRRSPRADGLATIEAAVQCLNALESERDFSPMLRAFDTMIDFQITAMGKKTYLRNHKND
ncbi:DTW domain-containing protein [Litorivivens lipolytica]